MTHKAPLAADWAAEQGPDVVDYTDSVAGGYMAETWGQLFRRLWEDKILAIFR